MWQNIHLDPTSLKRSKVKVPVTSHHPTPMSTISQQAFNNFFKLSRNICLDSKRNSIIHKLITKLRTNCADYRGLVCCQVEHVVKNPCLICKNIHIWSVVHHKLFDFDSLELQEVVVAQWDEAFYKQYTYIVSLDRNGCTLLHWSAEACNCKVISLYWCFSSRNTFLTTYV